MPDQLEDYDVLGIIGVGNFGSCYKIKKKSTGHLYVWKAIDYGQMTEEKRKLIVSEVNLLSELHHPNIVQYYGRIIHKKTRTLYIITELCEGGDLKTVITKCKKKKISLQESFIWQVVYQLCRALQACHSHLLRGTILHRDIKPANVFLDKFSHVKLGDFGLARILEEGIKFAESFVGTPYYMSPEVVNGSKYNKKSDIWSLGCLIYELCVLHPPFSANNIKELEMKINRGRIDPIPSFYSDDLQKVISMMLTVDQALRPPIEVFVHHPLIVSHVAQETLSSMVTKSKNSLCYKSPCRNSSSDESNSGACQKFGKDEVFIKQENDTNTNLQALYLQKLETLKQRETTLRRKELAVTDREAYVEKREKELSLLDRLAKEKMSRAKLYLKQCRENQSSSSSGRSSAIMHDNDSSFSADPGDNSILPTSNKLNPENVLKPSNFDNIHHQRKVHFSAVDVQPQYWSSLRKHIPLLISGTSEGKEISKKKIIPSENHRSLHKNVKQSADNNRVPIQDNFQNNMLLKENLFPSFSKKFHRNLSTYENNQIIWLQNKRSKHNQTFDKTLMSNANNKSLKSLSADSLTEQVSSVLSLR